MRTKHLAHRRMRCTPCYIELYANVHHVRASRHRLHAVMHPLPDLASGAWVCSSMHIVFCDTYGIDFEVSHDNK
jgi:hypothetical protein